MLYPNFFFFFFSKKDVPKNLWPAAAANVNHHLDKLLKENRVTKKQDMWSLTQSVSSHY